MRCDFLFPVVISHTLPYFNFILIRGKWWILNPWPCLSIPHTCLTIQLSLQLLISYLMGFQCDFLGLFKINMLYVWEEAFLVHSHTLSLTLHIVLLYRPGYYDVHAQAKLSSNLRPSPCLSFPSAEAVTICYHSLLLPLYFKEMKSWRYFHLYWHS